jgi:hypothetical protein
MNTEYQRLEVQATACWQQLTAQAGSVTVSSAAEAMQLEEQILHDAAWGDVVRHDSGAVRR